MFQKWHCNNLDLVGGSKIWYCCTYLPFYSILTLNFVVRHLFQGEERWSPTVIFAEITSKPPLYLFQKWHWHKLDLVEVSKDWYYCTYLPFWSKLTLNFLVMHLFQGEESWSSTVIFAEITTLPPLYLFQKCHCNNLDLVEGSKLWYYCTYLPF